MLCLDGDVMVVLSWVCTSTETHWTVHFKWVQFIVYKLYPNKVVKNKTGKSVFCSKLASLLILSNFTHVIYFIRLWFSNIRHILLKDKYILITANLQGIFSSTPQAPETQRVARIEFIPNPTAPQAPKRKETFPDSPSHLTPHLSPVSKSCLCWGLGWIPASFHPGCHSPNWSFQEFPCFQDGVYSY